MKALTVWWRFLKSNLMRSRNLETCYQGLHYSRRTSTSWWVANLAWVWSAQKKFPGNRTTATTRVSSSKKTRSRYWGSLSEHASGYNWPKIEKPKVTNQAWVWSLYQERWYLLRYTVSKKTKCLPAKLLLSQLLLKWGTLSMLESILSHQSQ